MTNYEMSKTLVAQFANYSDEDIKAKKPMLTEFFKKDTAFMLLCKDTSYYTVFINRTDVQPKFCDEVMECIQTQGFIKAMDLTDDGNAIEIWVQPAPANEPIVMYLFPYSKGVIECRA